VVKPLIGRVYVDPEPLSVPLVTPVTPLKVMLEAERPVIAWLKVSVNCVVVVEELPFAVTLLRVTAMLTSLLLDTPALLDEGELLAMELELLLLMIDELEPTLLDKVELLRLLLELEIPEDDELPDELEPPLLDKDELLRLLLELEIPEDDELPDELEPPLLDKAELLRLLLELEIPDEDELMLGEDKLPDELELSDEFSFSLDEDISVSKSPFGMFNLSSEQERANVKASPKAAADAILVSLLLIVFSPKFLPSLCKNSISTSHRSSLPNRFCRFYFRNRGRSIFP